MASNEPRHGPCPLEEGDRVDHRIFGFGTIVGKPIAAVGGSMTAPYVVARGWSVRVEWDDPTRAPSSIGFEPERSDILRKVSSPDARGNAYWENEWRKRLEPFLAARARTDEYVEGAFRSMLRFSADELSALQRSEREALDALVGFLAADERGEHP